MSRAESRDKARRELADAAKACVAQLAALVKAAGPDYDRVFRALVRAGQNYDRYRELGEPAFDDLLGPAAEPDAVEQLVDVSRAKQAFVDLVAEVKSAKPSRVSVPPPPKSSRRSLALTGQNLYAEAAKLPASAHWHRQTFLAPLLERFGTTPQAARAALLELFQDDQIVLTRADLVEAMPYELVKRSAIKGPGGSSYEFHFLAPKGW